LCDHTERDAGVGQSTKGDEAGHQNATGINAVCRNWASGAPWLKPNQAIGVDNMTWDSDTPHSGVA